MKPLQLAPCALLCILLTACVSHPVVAPEPASKQANAPQLVVQGALTEEGQRKRHLGQHHVARDRNAEAYAEWLPLAAAGHAESQYNLGLMTRQGLGTPVDLAASLAWMERAAAAGYRDALLELGLRLATGNHGAARDSGEAMRLLLRAAELGDATAAFHAGQYLYYGHGVPKDCARGIALLLQAAGSETPSVQAQAMLGRIYLAGGDTPVNTARALFWLDQAAAADEPEAQFLMGVLHQHGQGVPKNLHKAHGWYLRAAQQGHAPALNRIGMLYRNGEGVKKNLGLARSRFEQAHARGSVDAAVNLGDLLIDANSTAAAQRKAVALYQSAAQARHGRGQCRYGQALMAGAGVARDAQAAARWMAGARKAGNDCKPLYAPVAQAQQRRTGQ